MPSVRGLFGSGRRASEAELRKRLDFLAGEISKLDEALRNTRHAVDEAVSANRDELERIVRILELVYDGEPANRRRLYELREGPDYAPAFEEAEPLISILIPTYTSYATLGERAIPSALAQTYRYTEIVVVGDCAPDETAEVVAGFDDPRISYVNRPMRGPYPDDSRDLWHVAGTPPLNEAVRMARGRWLAPMADDDHLRANHLELLLSVARESRCEVVYGKLLVHPKDGEASELGVFPPSIHQFGWQGAIFHAGLRFFELELADALFDRPADWAKCRRMMRAGVRFKMIDEVVCDYYPSESVA